MSEAIEGDIDLDLVAIPVCCPQCGIERMCEFPAPVVFIALTRWNNMNLYANCHHGSWCASRSELQSIRQYLGEHWLESRRVQGARHTSAATA